jgi:hypothetical protein
MRSYLPIDYTASQRADDMERLRDETQTVESQSERAERFAFGSFVVVACVILYSVVVCKVCTTLVVSTLKPMER